jgi:DNA-binding NtrC family response regulator
LTSKNILIVDDSNGQNRPCYKKLEDEIFAVLTFSSVEDALKDSNKPQLVILDLKLNGDDNVKTIEKFKTKNAPIIVCLEWGKDKLSFQLLASDVTVVKSGDHRDLKLTIKEIIG